MFENINGWKIAKKQVCSTYLSSQNRVCSHSNWTNTAFHELLWKNLTSQPRRKKPESQTLRFPSFCYALSPTRDLSKKGKSTCVCKKNLIFFQLFSKKNFLRLTSKLKLAKFFVKTKAKATYDLNQTKQLEQQVKLLRKPVKILINPTRQWFSTCVPLEISKCASIIFEKH